MANSLWDGRRLGVVGGGTMAEALIRGVLAAELLPAARITVYDIAPARRTVFAALGCVAAEEAGTALREDVVLLATKPQQIDAALAHASFRSGQIVISIAAGVPCARLEALAGGEAKVIRVMPNTPLLVGRGVSALAAGTRVGSQDMELALALFRSAGDAMEVTEDKLDAVTALSGSGPAYLFAFAEALAAGAVSLGLEPDLAMRLLVGTLGGAAEMLDRYGNPARLREQVTSPGGTTAAALRVFEERGMNAMVAAALRAARDRGAELGRGE